MIMIFRKKYLIPFLLLFFVELCNAQILKNTDDLDFYKKNILYCFNYLSKTDSLAYVNRRRADKVLSCFSEYSGKKLLYVEYGSRADNPHNPYPWIRKDYYRDYYVIVELNTEERLKEFLVRVDMKDEIKEITELRRYAELKSLSTKKRLKSKEKKRLLQLERYRKIILDEGFNVKNYSKKFITNYIDTTESKIHSCSTIVSYFVLKDTENNRYGEFFCRDTKGGTPVNINIRYYYFATLFLNNWN